MQCDLCGSTTDVEIYGVYPPASEDWGQTTYSTAGSQQTVTRRWDLSPSGFRTRSYCAGCVDAARKRSVRHAFVLPFLPTYIMRFFKFRGCSNQELGDLMVASELAQRRNPVKKHIIWPYGGGDVPTMEHHLTREKAAKRLAKQSGR